RYRKTEYAQEQTKCENHIEAGVLAHHQSNERSDRCSESRAHAEITDAFAFPGRWYNLSGDGAGRGACHSESRAVEESGEQQEGQSEVDKIEESGQCEQRKTDDHRSFASNFIEHPSDDQPPCQN